MSYQRFFLAATVLFFSLGSHYVMAKIYDPKAASALPFVKTPEAVDQKPLSAEVEIDVIQVGPGSQVNTNGKTKEEMAKEYFENPLPLPSTSVVLPPDSDDH